jgi:hypothetical protein
MKTELRAKPQSIKGQYDIELWYDGHLIGTVTVTGADGPGVRITTEHDAAASIATNVTSLDGRTLCVVDLAITPEK